MSDLAINRRLTIPAAELSISFARSGGPGGQNVNKVETQVEVRWSPVASQVLTEADRELLLKRLSSKLTTDGELVVTSSRTREQARNRADALDKLAKLVRKALVRPKRRKPTKPSRAAVKKRLETKRQRGRIKRDRQAPNGTDE